jgi:serine/threonine protein kinase
MSNPNWIGQKLNDRYEINELLGQGGMSSVYRAEDPNLRRTVAIKMIHPHLSRDPSFVSRFEEEASSVAQLRNPHIIQVYDFANDADTYYMVLEFVPGETLQDHLKRMQQSGKQMEIKDVIKYMVNICDALEYAHTRGLIHRDIKPANIMLSVEGQAILMDFGIAKIVGGKQHTATGAVVGTALYMAPEIIKGEPADKRVDIYSLGVTLFETLTGNPPFQADSAMTIMMMHVNDPLPDLREINPDVPMGLVEVVKKALAKNKEDRFQSAAEFAQALRSVDLSAPAPAESTMIEETPAMPPLEQTIIEEAAPQAQYEGTAVEEIRPAASSSAASGRIPPPPQTASPAGAGGGLKNRLPLLIGGGVVILVIIIGVILFGNGAFGQDPVETEVAAAVTTIPPSPTNVVPTKTETPTFTPEPTLTPTATDPAGPYVRINSIRIEGGYYIVEYETFGYTEVLPGVHIHFFFNNITPENAGSGGTGPWYLWGGPRPFNGYAVGDKPADATQMCALQANANHTINLGTGNCVDLPTE